MSRVDANALATTPVGLMLLAELAGLNRFDLLEQIGEPLPGMKRRQMPGEALIALAPWAGQTVAAAAVTDVWESARRKVAQLFGRNNPKTDARDPAHRHRCSEWRRHHQYQTCQAHQRGNAYADATS